MQKRLLVPPLAVGLAAIALPVTFAEAQETETAFGLELLGSYDSGVFAESAAEIVTYDPATQRIFTVNAQAAVVDVLDAADPAAPAKLFELDAADAVGAEGAVVNSVAVHGDLAAAATEAPDKTEPGWVVFFGTDGDYRSHVQVGAQPDSIAFTPDGRYAVTADEGEPADDYSVDPAGTVSIVDAASGDVRTADFTAWDDADLPDGVRAFGPDGPVSAGIEPEYVTVPNDTTAYVTLQENNAIAAVDIENAEISEILPLGFKDHLVEGNELDASNRDDAINLANWPVNGMYLPDTVASYTAGGETYLVTANEGDSRDWEGYSEEERVADLELCEGASRFDGFDLAELQADENLGRLKVTSSAGQTDEGCYDELYSFGARSFSIWSADGELVFDSGAQFEELLAVEVPDNFNADNEENTFDDRSDDKGPEPEAVEIGVVGDRTYAFIGLERQGGIMLYDVTDPASPSFVDYVSGRDFTDPVEESGDLGPESLEFVPAENSAAGRPLLIVGNEVSGTTTVYGITGEANGGDGGNGDDPSDQADEKLPATGTGATGLLVGTAAALALAGGAVLLARRRTA